jgi:hypothetical protein
LILILRPTGLTRSREFMDSHGKLGKWPQLRRKLVQVDDK